ncbi:ATP-binding protein [uncultured Pseudacidovorax sp.]|uniref:ATP-binding protein n=1 Tax=uncultured Pseudacidovorax sp. TaxID=679313 RepID=UPI0025E64D47|nr:4Fe-4S dicluster domain-containing protein [uncultured Pseudacidovorax sp.]
MPATLPPSPASAARHRPGWQPVVEAARCTGCGWCVAACPPHVLSLAVRDWKKQAVLHDAPGCTGCSDCAVVCPFRAITMRRVAPKTRGTGEPANAAHKV